MSAEPMLPGFDEPTEALVFEPTRNAGLARLDRFVGRAGRPYASKRNYDFGPDRRSNVSALSPWIRHRLITEEEVLRATLARHSPSAAEKFIQEVFWRTYFKGWLEQRPSVWISYLEGLSRARDRLDADRAMEMDYDDAIAGRTGIDGFDQWTRELVETGYLHNHARMWFASIWIFTLRLPWELGADFFLQHLMDGDPASNTLSWRWVSGLHTKGKTYLARVANIAKYTNGRFRPEHQLAPSAEALVEGAVHPLVPIPAGDPMPDGDMLLLLTEEDLSIDALLPRPPAGVLGLLATEGRASGRIGAAARAFAHGAAADAVARCGGGDIHASGDWTAAILAAAERAGTRVVVTGYAPVGPVAARLDTAKPTLAAEGVSLVQLRRNYDVVSWPHSTRGFFALKQKIPKILNNLGLAS